MQTTVAIVHYHLSIGGVSKVISEQAKALKSAKIPFVILTGHPSANDEPWPILQEFSQNWVPVKNLGYLSPPTTATPADLKHALTQAASHALGEPPTVWIFHNHSIGKNLLLPQVVADLANEHARLILQIHDFAEDGRPQGYQNIPVPQCLYPHSNRIHYALLNQRDRQRLHHAGLPDGQSSILPNPISPQKNSSTRTPAPIIFYPTRGIRRKNLGELLLFATMLPEGGRIAVSKLPPDPSSASQHDTWQSFAHRLKLPVDFNVVDHIEPIPGAPTSFESWKQHASHLISTSISEGFGYCFLEAAAWHKKLIGRNIPFLKDEPHVQLHPQENLYDQLLIPIEWIGPVILREQLKIHIDRINREYQLPPSHDAPALILDRLIQNDWVDFGNLPESLQQTAVERAHQPQAYKIPLIVTNGTTLPAYEWFRNHLANPDTALSDKNLTLWTQKQYLKNLKQIISIVKRPRKDSPPSFLPAKQILHESTAPHNFHFLQAPPPKITKARSPFKAVIFDIYGTLLIAPNTGVKPDPQADPLLRKIIRDSGFEPPESPSTELHQLVTVAQRQARIRYAEVDLRAIWRKLLNMPSGFDTSSIVDLTENAWHPVAPMPHAWEFVRRVSRLGIPLGILSNAQSNTLKSLGDLAELFTPSLSILSYQHGYAKPSPILFQKLALKLSELQIKPEETLIIGNDPLQDIVPATDHGFKTALFTGHPDSLRDGQCSPNFTFSDWNSVKFI